MEEWRKIPGYPSEYEVSSYGRVRRLESQYVSVTGENTKFGVRAITRAKPAKIYQLRKLSQKGYQRINLCKKTRFVHNLVMLAFIPNPLNLPQCNHKNGIKTDNRIENLEWSTNQQNRDHAVANLLHSTEPRPHTRKYNDATAKVMQKLAIEGMSLRKIASQFGTSHSTVIKILNRLY